MNDWARWFCNCSVLLRPVERAPESDSDSLFVELQPPSAELPHAHMLIHTFPGVPHDAVQRV